MEHPSAASLRACRGRRPNLTSGAGWAGLLLGLAAAAAFVAIAGYAGPRLPGAAGATFNYNRRHDLDAAPLFYTEAGDVREFLAEGEVKYTFDR